MKRYIHITKQIYNSVPFHNFSKIYRLPYMVTNPPDIIHEVCEKFIHISFIYTCKSKDKTREMREKFPT